MTGAFVSSLYAQPGMQPILPRAKYGSLAVKLQRDAYPAKLAVLREALSPGAPPGTPANVVNWPKRYRYLYLIGPGGPDPLPATLTRVAAGRRFQLFRIDSGG